MAVETVVAGVDFPANEPLPEWRIARVERLVPLLVPAEHLRVLVEALRKVIQREALVDAGILQVRLLDELLRRIEVLFFLPVNRNLGFSEVETAHEGSLLGLSGCEDTPLRFQ